MQDSITTISSKCCYGPFFSAAAMWIVYSAVKIFSWTNLCIHPERVSMAKPIPSVSGVIISYADGVTRLDEVTSVTDDSEYFTTTLMSCVPGSVVLGAYFYPTVGTRSSSTASPRRIAAMFEYLIPFECNQAPVHDVVFLIKTTLTQLLPGNQ